MSNRYLDRDAFAKDKNPGEGFALTKAGGFDGLVLKGRDELRDFLTKDGADLATVERAVDESKQDEVSFPFVLSTADPDRQGDVIRQEGWDLSNYKKNPVVLWAHDYEQLPVARASAVYLANGKLKAVDRFSDDHELARTVAALYAKGFLSAVSVGFRPKKWQWNEERGGMAADFDECELLEHSCVPVPAHQDALIEARSLGLSIGPVLKWAEAMLAHSDGLFLPKALLESTIAKASTRVVVDFGDRKSLLVSDVPAPVEAPAVTLDTAIGVIARAGFAVLDPAALVKLSAPAPVAAPVPDVAPEVITKEPAPAAAPETKFSDAVAAEIRALVRAELGSPSKSLADLRMRHTGRLD